MNLIRIRRFIQLVGLGMICISIYYLDETDLTWEANASNYLGAIAGLAVTLSMYFSNKMAQRKKQE